MKYRNISSIDELKVMAKQISLLTLDISYKANTGHVGSSLSIVDILTVLYFFKMNINKLNINSNERDRFILSKGHAVAALYSTLYKKGVFAKERLLTFGEDSGGLSEHPEINDPGIEMSTGSLGHGLGFGVGIALGQKQLKLKNNTYVLISDGESGEGSVWEAALLASRLNLDNLTVIVDYNKWQCFGKSKEISNLEPFIDKWKSFGWEAKEINGHDISEIKKKLNDLPFKPKKPSLIIAHTISGLGISLIENTMLGHYKIFNKNEYEKARKELLAYEKSIY